jgi:hypothetical protein
MGCAAESEEPASPEDVAAVDDADDAATSEAALTQTEVARREAICAQVQPGRPWTEEEATRLQSIVIRHIVDLKRDNDRLIRERGVGRPGRAPRP